MSGGRGRELFLTLLNKVKESKEKNMTVAMISMMARVVRNSPHNSVFKEDILPEVTAMCKGTQLVPVISTYTTT